MPIHKDEKLARSLSVLDIGEYIPQELYSIVAEVLVLWMIWTKFKVR